MVQGSKCNNLHVLLAFFLGRGVLLAFQLCGQTWFWAIDQKVESVDKKCGIDIYCFKYIRICIITVGWWGLVVYILYVNFLLGILLKGGFF